MAKCVYHGLQSFCGGLEFVRSTSRTLQLVRARPGLAGPDAVGASAPSSGDRPASKNTQQHAHGAMRCWTGRWLCETREKLDNTANSWISCNEVTPVSAALLSVRSMRAWLTLEYWVAGLSSWSGGCRQVADSGYVERAFHSARRRCSLVWIARRAASWRRCRCDLYQSQTENSKFAKFGKS